MTTKPKAKKFRIKRSAPRPATGAGSASDATDADQPPSQPGKASAPRRPSAAARPQSSPIPDPDEDNSIRTTQAYADARARATQSNNPAPDPAQDQTQSDAPTDIDAIRREGLTGRQLRMARRVAQKHGLAPTSDFDAVRLLRAKGVDPFQRANMLELVVPQNDGATGAREDTAPGTNLPQTVPAGGNTLPSTEQLSPARRREREISEIQHDIARRRRKKMGLLLTRLSFFVLLPSFLAGWYFYQIATPMFATKSEFLIIQNEGAGGSGPLGGLLPTQFATSQDSIAVQSFLQSKDAMLRLDEDAGFKTHFTNEAIDPIQRLDENPTNEKAYKTFKKNVKIGFDPTEGVIRMEVIAATPEASHSFSEKLISYAEKRVNDLSVQKREDQMRDAREALVKAETDRRSAQEDLVELQIEGATLDPEAVIAGLRTQITTLETLIYEKERDLASLLANSRPNRAKVDGEQRGLEILRDQLLELEARMIDVSQGENSLATLAVRIQLAQADLATRDLMLQSALQQTEQARTEANRQVRYLTVAVRPVQPEEASYPRKFENTILAFLIFAGIYLMISLTSSILREQVTS